MKFKCDECAGHCRLDADFLAFMGIPKGRCILIGKKERRHPAKWIKIEDVKE